MKYTNIRSDYPTISDAQFANARAVSAGNLADTEEKMLSYEMPLYSKSLWDNAIMENFFGQMKNELHISGTTTTIESN